MAGVENELKEAREAAPLIENPGVGAEGREVHCDHCRKPGWRDFRRAAPAGWLYLEAFDDETPEEVTVMRACSAECSSALWREGPGPLLDPATETESKS